MQDKKDILNKIKQLQKETYKKHVEKYQSGGMFPQPASTPYLGFPYGDFQYTNSPENGGLNIDPLNNEPVVDSMSIYTNPEQLNRMAQNNFNNTFTGNYDENGNAINPNVSVQTINKNQIYNPYGGVSLENALFNFGQSLGYTGENKTANTFRGVASGAKVALGGLRSILSGAGYQKANDRVENQFIENLYGATGNFQWMQDGGEVTNAEVLTGAYAVPTPSYNVEIENGEIVQLPTGQIQEAVGDKHSEGGIKTELPSGSKILSDHAKIGARNAKLFRKEFDVKVKATDTYASVMDKYNNKVGWTDLIEDEKKTIEEIGNQEQSNIDNTTKDINLNFLSEKLQKLQAEKELVNPLQDEAFNKIFEKQESGKPADKKEDVIMQEGGQVDPKIMELAQQYNLTPERVMELIQQQSPNPVNADVQNQVVQALQQGATPDQIVEYLVQNGMAQEEAIQMIADSQQLANTEVQSFQAGGYVFFNQSKFAQDPYNKQPFVGGNTFAAGVETEEQILERLQYQNQQLPYIIRQSGIYSDNAGAFPNLKNTGAFQRSYDDYINQTVVEIDNNPFLTDEQKAQYKQQAESQRLSLSKQGGDYDNIYGLETSSRSNFNLPYLTVEEQKQYPNLRFIGDAIDDNGKIKQDFANLSPETQKLILETYGRGKEKSLNIGLGVVPTTPSEENSLVAEQNPQVIRRQNLNMVNANIPVDYILPPSPMQAVFKPSVSLGRIDPVKVSIEPNLIEANRQMQSTVEALNFLPEGQRAAAVASILGQTQNATNQAITGAETYNADARMRADTYNTQQSDKQQLLDAEISQNYEQKMFQTMANQEAQLRSYFNELNDVQRFNFNYIDRRNAFNEAPLQYKIGNGEIVFQDNGGNIVQPTMNGVPVNYASLSPAAKKEYEKQLGKQLAKNRAKN